MGGVREITVSSQVKSADTVADVDYHSGEENREKFSHANPDIDTDLSYQNESLDFFDMRELQEKHYKQKIEDHNRHNNSEARRWDLDKCLASFEGKAVLMGGKATKNVRWSTASQISYFGGKDSLNDVLEELEQAGASPEDIRDAYTSGYKDYVEQHNEKFWTLPIYHSDIHFDETTPHGHDAMVVMGHTPNGKASDSMNNALGEMYGHAKKWDGKQANMSRYRDENDAIMFNAIGSKLEALGEAHGMDFKFKFLRLGETGSRNVPEYKAHMELEKKRESLDAEANIQKIGNKKIKERKAEVTQRERAVDVREDAVTGRESEVLAKEKELKEKEEKLKADAVAIEVKAQEVATREDKLNRMLVAEMSKMDKHKTLATVVAIAAFEGDPKYEKWVDIINKDERGVFAFKPEPLQAGLADTMSRMASGKRKQPVRDGNFVNKEVARREAEKDDGPEL